MTAGSTIVDAGPVAVPANGRLVVATRQGGSETGFNFGFCLLRFVPDGNDPGAVVKVWGTPFWCVADLGGNLTPGSEGRIELEPRSINLAWARSGFQLQLEVAALQDHPS